MRFTRPGALAQISGERAKTFSKFEDMEFIAYPKDARVSETITSRFLVGCHPRMRFALDISAMRTAGSPARLGESINGI
jgi:hypothetical protein